VSLISSLLRNATKPAAGAPEPATDSAAGASAADPAELRRLYLDMVQRTIINTVYEDPAQTFGDTYRPEVREIGSDWPSVAHSMIGNRRMTNLRQICEIVIGQNVPGDFIETGVWRGGACILMRAVLKAWNITDRSVWVADSFAGLPRPTPDKYPADKGDTSFEYRELAISLEQVQSNFAKYDLLDAQVRFLKGWFKDTLPAAPIERLAVLRLDGDMYESTMDALDALYHKVSPGGFVIVDDFILPKCRAAISDFRHSHAIGADMFDIDGAGAFWRKE
jgi:hypothetical protein